MKNKIFNCVIALTCVVFASCENLVVMNTKVHEDGSVDKTIMLGKQDSFRVEVNPFGINQSANWDVSVEKSKDEKDGDSDKLDITFTKSFASVDDMNKELDRNIDSLFQIHATFEKQFRWFYTYIYYSETIRPIDRLELVEATDYFTREDFAFIDRLPGEGAAISKADSIYLQDLNEKIFDSYAEEGLFAEHFEILKGVVKKNTNDPKWLDTLLHKRHFVYEKMKKDDVGDPEYASLVADTLGIPISKQSAESDFKELAKAFNARLGFMSYARDGKYVNSIEMPWTVIRSNADSVAGNTLYWKPLATKFAIQEFTMIAESRQFNWWTTALTSLLIGATIFLFVRRTKSI